jgi:hypothetical protein
VEATATKTPAGRHEFFIEIKVSSPYLISTSAHIANYAKCFTSRLLSHVQQQKKKARAKSPKNMKTQATDQVLVNRTRGGAGGKDEKLRSTSGESTDSDKSADSGGSSTNSNESAATDGTEISVSDSHRLTPFAGSRVSSIAEESKGK